MRRVLANPNMSAVFMFGLTSAEVDNILQFLYTGQVSLKTSEVQAFMKIAEQLEIRNIREQEKEDIGATRKRQRTSKKFYSKEGIKKVNDSLKINHVLKVEVNDDNGDVNDPPRLP